VFEHILSAFAMLYMPWFTHKMGKEKQ